MTIEAYPFENSQVSTEIQWQRMARIWMPDGVDTLPTGGSLKVTVSSGLTLNVAEGHAILRGVFYRQVGNYSISVPANGATTPRLDRIVLRADLNANTIAPFVIVGTPAATPSAPAMTYTETVFDLPLALVRVEANDTITTTPTDVRRFVGRPVVYCTSTNRPDPQGRPLVAFETDTKRVIFSSGSGAWNVGLGDELYRPSYVFHHDAGAIGNGLWQDFLTETTQPRTSLSFTAPPSGRVRVAIGGYLRADGEGSAVYMAVRLRASSGSDYWTVTDVPTGNPDASRMLQVKHPAGTTANTTLGASCAGVYHATLTPGTQYTASLMFSGGGYIDNRYLEVTPLP